MVAGEVDDFRMEKRYFRKDGDVVWTDLTASLIRDEAGVPRYMVAMFEDITRTAPAAGAGCATRRCTTR